MLKIEINDVFFTLDKEGIEATMSTADDLAAIFDPNNFTDDPVELVDNRQDKSFKPYAQFSNVKVKEG